MFFRRLLAIQPAKFDGSAKINYFKSRRIRWYHRDVQENSVWLSIFVPKVGPCQATNLEVVESHENDGKYIRLAS